VAERFLRSPGQRLLLANLLDSFVFMSSTFLPCMHSNFTGIEAFMISLFSVLTNIIGILPLSVCFAVSLNTKPSIFVLDIGKSAINERMIELLRYGFLNFGCLCLFAGKRGLVSYSYF